MFFLNHNIMRLMFFLINQYKTRIENIFLFFKQNKTHKTKIKNTMMGCLTSSALFNVVARHTKINQKRKKIPRWVASHPAPDFRSRHDLAILVSSWVRLVTHWMSLALLPHGTHYCFRHRNLFISTREN